MIPPELFPAFFGFFGQIGGQLLKKAAEKHVEDYLGKALDKASALGQKSAFEEAMERAYGGWLEAMLKYLEGLGYDAEDLATYKESFERLLDDREVGEELARPILDGEDWAGPELRTFVDAWARLGCRPLPDEFRWPPALAAFERQVRKQRVLTPELRDVLNAVNLAAIRDELRRLGGVRPEGNERRYAAAMRQRYRVLDLLAIARPEEEKLRDLELRDVFLPQNVRENPPPVELPWDLRRKLAASGRASETSANASIGPLPEEISLERLNRVRSAYAEQPKRPALEVLTEPTSRRLVLLGDPGSGKSTLAKYLLLSVLDPPRVPATGSAEAWVQAFSGCLPLLIEIREFIGERSRGTCQTFLEFLHYLGKTQGYALEETWLAQRLRSGPSLVLFDGLDEIFDAGDRERLMREIAGFCSDYPQASVVVTSRTVGYTDSIFRAAGFRHFAIQDLDDEQVERFIRGWYGLIFPGRPEEAAPRIDRVLKACGQSRSIRLLAGNPMLLTIMAMIARQQELPRERARFYEYSAEILCHHWDLNRRLRDAGFKFDYIGLDDKTELLRRIAFRMQGGPQGLAGNFIHGDDLQEEVQAYLAERYRVPATEAKQVALALIEQLHARNYILCLYGPGLYGFVHRTFLEYFCAAELTRRVQQNPNYTIDRLIEEVIARHWQEPAWNEVLRLLCGMVGEAYAGRIIEYLTGQGSPFWKADPARRPPRSLVLATQCLAEVRSRYAIESACLALLQAIVSALEVPTDFSRVEDWTQDFLLDLPAAFAEVAPTWPGSSWLGESFISGIDRVTQSLKDVYVRFAVALFPKSTTVRTDLETLSRRPDSSTRSAALTALAETWPQEAGVWELLQEQAHQDEDPSVRRVALIALAESWPQEAAVRALLEQRALHDEAFSVRGEALNRLAQGWPQDAAVRDLLEQRALQDEAFIVRGEALSWLARGWPQEPAVRDLLEERALHDGNPTVRRMALSALARGWPQEVAVRELLEQRAIHEEASSTRCGALNVLATVWWQEAAVRQLVEQRALQDVSSSVRAVALAALARTWPQNATVRKLLEQRAFQDKASSVRARALRELARWPHEVAVRDLLEQRALHDEDSDVRRAALSALARGWPKEAAVRALLEQRARQDEQSDIRRAALKALAEGWPQEAAVRHLLEHRAHHDQASDARQEALGALVYLALDSRAAIVLSEDLDGVSPFLDPRFPVSTEHIEGAAAQLGLGSEVLDLHLKEYSRMLGWDLRKGLGEPDSLLES